MKSNLEIFKKLKVKNPVRFFTYLFGVIALAMIKLKFKLNFNKLMKNKKEK